jgi:outer membrane protein insertion porin family
VPLTEYLSLSARYGLTFDDVGLDERTYYTNGVCDRILAGRYLCDAIGNRATSSVGYSLIYDSLNSRLRPTAGQRVVLSQDFAGLGGDVRYIRTKFDADKYWGLGSGFTLGLSTEGGYIHSLEGSRGEGIDKVRITDRFYLGEPEFRGFDIRGVGPRVQRFQFTTDAAGKQILVTDKDQIIDDALGGRAYYSGRLELEIPLGAGARELGLRPTIYVQAGALFGVTRPLPTIDFPVAADGTVLPLPLRDSDNRDLFYYTNAAGQTATTICSSGLPDAGGGCNGITPNTPAIRSQPFFERFVGNSAKPRVSVGTGVNWNSPFGPLRVDLAYALVKDEGDDDKLITFNVGTAF